MTVEGRLSSLPCPGNAFAIRHAPHRQQAFAVNAVAMQVFAAAIIHTAFRIAQGNLAKKVGLPPEEISSEKLFPYLAIVSIKVLEATYCFFRICKANPGVELTEPSWDDLPGTTVSLRYLQVQHRSPIRKKREYDPERKKWKSITDVDGSEELTQLEGM